MLDNPCRCGHARRLHADQENPLQVVPLSMTEADAQDRPELPDLVWGAGHCTVAGCGCEQFTDAGT
jgi:hypothetical protein